MDRDKSSRQVAPSRRTFIKGTGSAVAAGLIAGCTGDGGGGGDGDQTTGGGGSGGGGGGGSQDWPTNPVEIVVPYGTSGGYNAYSRLCAKHMQEYLPVNVRVRNVTGASGRVATNQVYNAEPNGYTNQIVNVQSFVRQQIIYDPEYDLTEMTWYPQIAANVRAIGVGTNTDIENWDQYVEATKNGELTFAATGPASGGSTVPFVTGEVSGLYGAEKVLDNLVTFDGKGGSIKSIKSGDSQVMAGSYSSLLPFVESGDLRLVMITSWQDSAPEQTSDVPTFKSVDLNKGQEISDMLTARRVFAGPPGVPEQNANTLREAFTKAIQSDALQQEAGEIDRPIEYADSETAQKAVQNAFSQWNNLSDLLNEITST